MENSAQKVDRENVVDHLDRLSTRMSESVNGENAIYVSAAAIAVALDAAENLRDIKHLQLIHQHFLKTAEEVAKLIAAKAS